MAAKKYFIVNPQGTVHQVTREHAAARLQQPGWRMATKSEVAALGKLNGKQTIKQRAASAWVSDPDLVDFEDEDEEEQAAPPAKK